MTPEEHFIEHGALCDCGTERIFDTPETRAKAMDRFLTALDRAARS